MSVELSAPLENQAPSSPVWEPVGSGFSIRTAAQLIDMLVHLGVAALFFLVAGIGIDIYESAAGVSAESMVQKITTIAWYDYVAGALGFVLYHAVMEGRCGATIGKRLLRLVVVGTAGGRVTYRQALGRSFALYVDGFFFGLVAYSNMEPPLQQRFGDKQSATLVVTRAILPLGTARAMSHFGSALLPGLLSDAACRFVSVCIKLL